MKDLLPLIFCLFLSVNIFGQSALSGTVTDSDTGDPILFGDVVVYRNGALITGEQTDFDGNYILSPMDPGTYEVVFKYVGYTDVKYEGVLIHADKETILNASMSPGVALCDGLMHYRPPIIEADDFEKGQIFTGKDIRRMPNKN